VTYFDNSWIAGGLVSDTVTIGGLSATAVFAYASSESVAFTDGSYSGIIGAAFPSTSSVNDDSAFVKVAVANGLPTTLVTCLTNTGGSLILGEDLQNAPVAQYSYVPIVLLNGEQAPDHWTVALQDMTVNGVSIGFAFSTVILDTGNTAISLATPAFAAFQSTLSTYCQTVNALPFVCDSNGNFVSASNNLLNGNIRQLTAAQINVFPVLTFVHAGFTVTMPPSIYLLADTTGAGYSWSIGDSGASTTTILGWSWFVAAGRVALDYTQWRVGVAPVASCNSAIPPPSPLSPSPNPGSGTASPPTPNGPSAGSQVLVSAVSVGALVLLLLFF